MFLKHYWKSGRNQTGHFVHTICKSRWPIPFDIYILKFPEGSHTPPHKDAVYEEFRGRKHLRLNIVIKQTESGGEFRCQQAYVNFPRVKFFRPDIYTHRVDRITKGTRYVLSIGWIW